MTKDTIPVPCGKCPNCIKRRVSGWSFRLMQEEKRSTSAHFITLTYDTTHVPITKAGFMEIRKRDLQLFFKRLRKRLPGIKVKYYAVGEYGGKTYRPHYHIILFNCPVEEIQPAWELGHVHYGKLSEASVGYTLKYLSKPSRVPLHRNDDRTPEFALMSKGLGENYINDATRKYHHADLGNRLCLSIAGGKKISMPRYYKDKLYSDAQRKAAGYHAQKKYIAIQEKHIQENPEFFRSKAEADKHAFEKMHKQSLLNLTI